MSFKTFNNKPSGRNGVGNGISLNQTTINFGQNKPPYDYLVIEYDTDKPAIRFSKGDENKGYKVKYHKAYYLAASSFLKQNLIPKGRYSLTEELTYEQ